MSFVKLLLAVVLMCVILFFAVMNLEEKVSIKLWPGTAYTYDDVPLVVGMFLAYLLGIITYFFIALARDIRFRGTIGRLKRDNRSLQSELHHLRGSALDDLPTDEGEDATGREGQVQ